ncbi:O-antigen ligase family protein [Vibrio natriegens]|uniref:O-antigen ligase family protein n=1 Tax=Vibrio natriegens TaxID=691 RepID=UPI000803EA5A|nr:O-antigen ligase family protein [Vibrio natriegens]ANQ15912.1 hypothetical protein BA891_01155 [Vibrio natriegens]
MNYIDKKNNFAFLAIAILTLFIAFTNNAQLANIIMLVLVFFVFLSKTENNLILCIFLIPSIDYFNYLGLGYNVVTIFYLLVSIKYFIYFRTIKIKPLGLSLLIVLLSFEVFHVIYVDGYSLQDFIRWSILFSFSILVMIDGNINLNFLRLESAFVNGFLLSSIVGAYLFFYKGKVPVNDNIIPRFSGLSGDPNNFGMYALIIIAFMLAKFKYNRASTISLLTILLVLSFSVLTVSRSFFLVLFVIILLQLSKGWFDLKKSIRNLTFVSVLFVSFYWLLNTEIMDNIILRFSYGNISELSGSRTDIFDAYFNVFYSLDIYFQLFGAGINGYLDFYNEYSDLYSIVNPGDVVGPHNTIIEIFVSLGIIGSIVYVLLLTFAMFNNVNIRSDSDKITLFLPVIIIFIYSLSLQNIAKYVFYFLLLLVSFYMRDAKCER